MFAAMAGSEEARQPERKKKNAVYTISRTLVGLWLFLVRNDKEAELDREGPKPQQ